MSMGPMGMRPGIILLREGTDTSQVRLCNGGGIDEKNGGEDIAIIDFLLFASFLSISMLTVMSLYFHSLNTGQGPANQQHQRMPGRRRRGPNYVGSSRYGQTRCRWTEGDH